MDGLIGVYEGGPGQWNRTWGTWRQRSLYFATDPVAMDHVGWDIIDAKRLEQGWQPVARMGQLHYTPAQMLSARLASLAAHGTVDAVALAAVGPVPSRQSRDGAVRPPAAGTRLPGGHLRHGNLRCPRHRASPDGAARRGRACRCWRGWRAVLASGACEGPGEPR